MDIETMRKDRALGMAFGNAASAAFILGDRTKGGIDWPQLYGEVPFGSEAEISDISFELARDKLAPFVRANPDAPPEALYRQAAEDGVHGGDVNGWMELPLPLRFAYGLFSTTLLYADNTLALEQRLAEKAAKEPVKKTPIPEDERTIQRQDDVGASIGKVGKASPITRAGTQESKLNEDPASAHARAMSTDLHAKSGHPTLAERVAQEGVAAQLGKGPKKSLANARKPAAPAEPKKPAKPPVKPRAKIKAKRR